MLFMPRFAALLRGINVGKAKRVQMADLRGLLVTLGYTDVQTLLNSGNVVFTASTGTAVAHARGIHDGIANTLGVDANVIVVSASDFTAALAENPFREVATDASRFLVAFTQDTGALSALAGLTATNWSPEALAIGPHAAYLWCPGGIADSALGKSVNRALGDHVTSRNWATVEKITALLTPASE
jgi:uncharacterized protein (DUF1697 family)